MAALVPFRAGAMRKRVEFGTLLAARLGSVADREQNLRKVPFYRRAHAEPQDRQTEIDRELVSQQDRATGPWHEPQTGTLTAQVRVAARVC